MKTHWGKRIIRSVAIVLGAAALWLLTHEGVSALYWAISNALIKEWGVTNRNLYRAPWFVHIMNGYGALIAETLGALILLVATHILTRRLSEKLSDKRPALREIGRGLVAGAFMLTALWLIYLLTGTMRMARSAAFSQAGLFVYGAVILMIGGLSLAAQLIFGYMLIYPLLKRQMGRWGALAGMAILALLATAWDDSTRIIWLVNALLLAGICCVSCDARGSAGWLLGFRLALAGMNALFGLPGTENVLCETYLVNSAWLNGGTAGIMAGVGMTAALVIILLMQIRSLRKSAA